MIGELKSLSSFCIVHDNEEARFYDKCGFKEAEEMKIENVLELEYQDVFDDMVAVRIVYQNEEVLKRDIFRDDEIGVMSLGSPDFVYPNLFLRGRHKLDDDYCELVSRDKAIEIKEKVRKINEKYGIKKRWRAENGEKYYCITSTGHAVSDTDGYTITDSDRYFTGNYFETKEQAEIVLEKIKLVFKEEA